jgi:hypothetical protein
MKKVKDAIGNFLYWRYIGGPALVVDTPRVIVTGDYKSPDAWAISKKLSGSYGGQVLIDKFLEYVARNKKEIMNILGIDFKRLVLYCRVTLAIAQRESDLGKSTKYFIKQHLAPRATKAAKWARDSRKAGGLKDPSRLKMSKGQTQVKYDAMFVNPEKKAWKMKQRFGIDSEKDLKNEKGLLATMIHIDASYTAAIKVGYSTNTPGNTKGTPADSGAQKLFKSTGNAALDASIGFYSTGKLTQNLTNIQVKSNYIPCRGPACRSSSGTLTYGYIAEISKLIKNKFTSTYVQSYLGAPKSVKQEKPQAIKMGRLERKKLRKQARDNYWDPDEPGL